MKREIIFRGKRIDNGEWIEGTYHYSNDQKYHYILRREKFLERENEMALKDREVQEVIPETVCQYTGLKDKNGVKIFEGDILSDGKGEDACVFFTPPAFTAQTKSGEIFWLAEGKVNKMILEYTEVIGNIHDNKEV